MARINLFDAMRQVQDQVAQAQGNLIEAQPLWFLACACGKHFALTDAAVIRILDTKGEVIYEGCQECLEARLRETESAATLRGQIRAVRLLLRDMLDPRSWADGPAMLARVREQLAQLEQPRGG